MSPYIVARRASAFLAERDIEVERAWCDSFLTALKMAGCSLTRMRVDDLRLTRLDAPTRASAWPSFVSGKVSPVAGAHATLSPTSICQC